MQTLRIEHEVPSYDGWKKAFDSDPINRKQSGVKSYRIYKPADNTKLVIVELDFETAEQLSSTHEALQKLWNKVQGTIIVNPITRIAELAEAKNI